MIHRSISTALALSMCAALLTLSCGDNSTGPSGGGAPLEFDTFQSGVLAIGETTLTNGMADAGGATNSLGLNGPVGAPAFHSPNGRLYLVDQGNSRVLGYSTMPTATGQAADFVLGQPGFTSNTTGRSASKFTIPSRCVVSGNHLLLADYSNNRVLIWNSLPATDTPADVVVGQADFDHIDFVVDASHIESPTGLAVANGKLFIAEGARVTIWNTIPAADGTPASVVVGQPDFTTGTVGVTASKLNSPQGLWTDGRRLVVCDRINRRVLIWNTVPTANGAAADIVLGAPNFTTAGTGAASATNFGAPWGVTSDGTMLIVADYGFNRVLIFKPFPTANNPAAAVVLGQNSFTHSMPDDGDQDGVQNAVPTAATFWNPADVRLIGRRLFVADQNNNRVLVFDSK
jgi:hypothetical protein